MNMQAKLEQFCSDNPYDFETQAKRLLASKDETLILHVLALGFATARQRQRHVERDYMKNIGQAPPRERLVPGRVTGAVKVLPSKKTMNAMRQLIADAWRINGEQRLGDATANDLAKAVKRERDSSNGHDKNARFYTSLKQELGSNEKVRERWNEDDLRDQIEKVYGEFRKTEAA